MYIMEASVKVSKWGNSLAVRLPAEVVEKLQLNEGDEIDLRQAADGVIEVLRKPTREEMIKKLRQYRGSMPADFKFDRDEANER